MPLEPGSPTLPADPRPQGLTNLHNPPVPYPDHRPAALKCQERLQALSQANLCLRFNWMELIDSAMLEYDMNNYIAMNHAGDHDTLMIIGRPH